MRKYAIFLLAVAMLLLAGCGCKHEWQEADCMNPKTCTLCGETQGEALGHDWKKATCTEPRTCLSCGQTKGESLGHTWEKATCTTAKVCSVCAATEGEPLGHTWVEATCTTPKTCSVCSFIESAALGHSWTEATYSAPETCSLCGLTQGEPLVRVDLDRNTEEMVTVLNATMQVLGYKLTYWGLDDDGWPTYDLVESQSGNYTNVYVSFEPNADGSKVAALLVVAEDITDAQAVFLMGSVAGAGIVATEPEFDIQMMNQAFSAEPVVENNIYYYYYEDRGLAADMQVTAEYAVFWVYPVE